MSKLFRIDTSTLKEALPELHAGDSVLLSGTVYCARDAAHKRLMNMIKNNEQLPFDMSGAVIYYCGPTEAKPGMAVGSAGPTTSSRMDPFMDTLLDMGLIATIGKGHRSDTVNKKMLEKGAIYLCAMGGAGAIAAKSIVCCEVIAFHELGCESVKKMTFKDFPLIVGNDAHGGSIFISEVKK